MVEYEVICTDVVNCVQLCIHIDNDTMGFGCEVGSIHCILSNESACLLLSKLAGVESRFFF